MCSFEEKMKKGYVYLMTNATRVVLYVGVTSDIKKRVWQHKRKFFPNSFGARYYVHILVHLEEYWSIRDAIAREKEIKKWRREKKNWLIERENKYWDEIVV
jgi:putative endonuclease